MVLLRQSNVHEAWPPKCTEGTGSSRRPEWNHAQANSINQGECRKGIVSQAGNTLIPRRTTPFTERLRYSKYRERTRKHLGRLFDKLFTEFTGLHFHIAWTPASPRQWNARSLPTGCSACCRLSGSPLLPKCRTCGPKQLARALSADGDGHHFTCRLGVRNYWFPIRLRGELLGLAYLQALEHSTSRHPVRKRSARRMHPRPGREDWRHHHRE